MNIRTENWLGHEIRFVEKVPGDWWAVLADVANALGLKAFKVKQRLSDDLLSKYTVEDSLSRKQEMLIVNEYGIYETVFESRKKEAKEFKRWVFSIIKTLRQSTGLEGFQVFRMLDKDHQRSAMANLCKTIKNPVQVDFIKANTIANKAVSTKHGHSKMVKKNHMTPEMLVDRQPILDETVELMGLVSKFDLPIKVSETIYDRYAT
ncbi:BRO-N domain-containing protein [Paenibacillus sp. 1A_MP2]|uniref:BRO-N domain-containing protein n=1 Tax=Paenibacillus sp. 1A_MP2 TaxID=3457495 RepID=UPI003FCD855F